MVTSLFELAKQRPYLRPTHQHSTKDPLSKFQIFFISYQNFISGQLLHCCNRTYFNIKFHILRAKYLTILDILVSLTKRTLEELYKSPKIHFQNVFVILIKILYKQHFSAHFFFLDFKSPLPKEVTCQSKPHFFIYFNHPENKVFTTRGCLDFRVQTLETMENEHLPENSHLKFPVSGQHFFFFGEKRTALNTTRTGFQWNNLHYIKYFLWRYGTSNWTTNERKNVYIRT